MVEQLSYIAESTPNPSSSSADLAEFFRDRTKELRKMRAGDIAPNPLNWRRHSPAQIKAMQGILRELGYVGALLAREEPDGAVVLIDGHLRQSLNPEQIVPVLILDVTEEEARKILATYDPIGAMADGDGAAFSQLVDSFKVQDADMQNLIDAQRMLFEQALQQEEGEVIDPAAEWVGMPEFQQEDQAPFHTIHMHFASAGDLQDFARIIGQNLTENTKYAWHPAQVRERLIDLQLVDVREEAEDGE